MFAGAGTGALHSIIMRQSAGAHVFNTRARRRLRFRLNLLSGDLRDIEETGCAF